MPFWMSMFFQNSSSPIFEFFIYFHDILMILIVMLVINLFLILLFIYKLNNFSSLFPDSQSMEDLWLMIPIIFLIFIGFPSIKNLYMYEEFSESDLMLKVNGHQWYWSYELNNMNFDGIMNKEKYNFRLLETFNHLILPIKCVIQLLISSEDVIHSWAVPTLGIKMDATPGRISQTIMMINRPGIYVGQCSEICGTNHSFMPIMISSNSMNNFLF